MNIQSRRIVKDLKLYYYTWVFFKFQLRKITARNGVDTILALPLFYSFITLNEIKKASSSMLL